MIFLENDLSVLAAIKHNFPQNLTCFNVPFKDNEDQYMYQTDV